MAYDILQIQNFNFKLQFNNDVHSEFRALMEAVAQA